MAGLLDAGHVLNTSAATAYPAVVPVTGGALAAGDLIVAPLCTNTTLADAVTLPDSSWAAIVPSSVVSAAVGWGVWWHFVTAAEAASPPASWPFALATARAGNMISARYRGVDRLIPFDTAVSSITSGTTTRNVPSVTTLTPGCLLVGGANLQSATTQTIGVPPGWTQDDTTCGLSAGRGQVMGHLQLPTAGATGIQTFTASSALSGAGWMIALRPAASQARTTTATAPTSSPGAAAAASSGPAGALAISPGSQPATSTPPTANVRTGIAPTSTPGGTT
jgi:hypothetical protein